MVTFRLFPSLCVVAVSALLSAQPVLSQQGFARSEELQSLSVDLAGISTRVRQSVEETIVSMANLRDFSGDEQTDQAFAILDSIQAETRSVIDTIKPTSPFVSALDDARARVLVLLRREERDPPSPSRDSRIARLTSALASIEEQHGQILAAESTLTGLLADHSRLRAELLREGGVRAVELFVDDLSGLTAGLNEMTRVLSEISENVVVVPTSAQLASD